MVLILALVLVYAVMASQYESLRDPFIIMFSVPTAAIGVVLALKLTGTSFNMQAYIGIIMLAGIVVSNGILLVDYTNVLRRRDGLPLREAVELAGRTRLRPILMTSIATGARPGADVARHRRRQRAAGAAGARRDRRPDDVAADHARAGADGLHAVRRRYRRPLAERSKKAEQPSRRERRSMKRVVIVLLLWRSSAAAGTRTTTTARRPPKFTVTTAAVTRGDIVDTVGATGTLQAVTTVQVGTQVSGTISELHADFNSLVKKGQVLARLDPSLFDAQLSRRAPT